MPLELTELARKYFREARPEEINGNRCALCEQKIAEDDLALKATKSGRRGIVEGKIYGFRCCAAPILLPYQPEADHQEKQTHF